MLKFSFNLLSEEYTVTLPTTEKSPPQVAELFAKLNIKSLIIDLSP